MRIFYSGDVSIEHGGFFYDLSSWDCGYVSATRVTPCSDAGGPDNQFWVENLTVNLREGAALDDVLQCCGMTRETLPKGAARRHAIVECHIAYGAYDVEQNEVVQVGAKPDPISAGRPGFDPVRVNVVLRANASLRKYVRRVHIES